MKKPHKLYRALGGKRSKAGKAFASSCRPVRTLKSMFGWDAVARDAADNFNLAPTKENIGKVMQTIRGWGKSYRGPQLGWMFKILAGKPAQRPKSGGPHPELD